jgi:hypothetical protein
VISWRGYGTFAFGVNSQGQIAGAYDASGGTVRGYIRNEDNYVDIVPFGSRVSLARGINDNSTVVGIYEDAGGVARGFLYDGNSYTTLNDPNAVQTWPEEINNAGVIVGTGWESTGLPHLFVRDASGNFTVLYVDGFPAGAGGINDLGQIVGDYGATPDDIWGFVLTGGVNATPDKLVVSGATVTSALEINNLGQVVGMYSHGSWPDGPWRSFLATPIAAADFDKDGDVDGADMALWQSDYGVSANCDADGDGDTDGADFLVWQRQVGMRASATAAMDNGGSLADAGSVGYDGVPEPSALALGGAWLAAAVLARTRGADRSHRRSKSHAAELRGPTWRRLTLTLGMPIA